MRDLVDKLTNIEEGEDLDDDSSLQLSAQDQSFFRENLVDLKVTKKSSDK